MTEALFGFLNIDKPSGMTSHDVVAKIRRHARTTMGKTKVGHAGTLDPMATGVLVICLGHATRLSEYAMRSIKQYRATLQLGIETDTYDAEGQVIAQVDASHITPEALHAILPSYLGDIQQVPPMYSAIKKGGKKLYELARAGETIERPARAVTIHQISLIDYHASQLILDVTCSSGTYIRSLAHDIGAQLGVGAHLSGLIRSRSGTFHLEQAHSLSSIFDKDHWQSALIAPQKALADWHILQLTPQEIADIQLGRRIKRQDNCPDRLVMAQMTNGHLLAILENQDTYWKPHKVFLP